MAKKGSIKITMKSQDIVNMTTTFNVTASITTSGESYRGDYHKFCIWLNRGTECILPSWFDTISGWTVVYDTDGTRGYAYTTTGVAKNTTRNFCNFDVTLKHYASGESGTITASYDYADEWCVAQTHTTFPTIQPKSTLTVEDGTAGEELTITVKQNDPSFTHTITYTIGDFSETICEQSSDTTIKWTPPLEFVRAFPKSPSGVGKINIETFASGRSLGSMPYNHTLSVPKTMIPIIDEFHYTESPYFAIGGFAQGKSGMSATVYAHGLYEAEISEYETKVGNDTYYGKYIGTNVFKTAGTLTVTCRVKDTRGLYSEPHIFTIEVMPYATPNIKSLIARRCNQNGTYNHQGGYFSVEFEADISPLDGKNVVTYAVGYKKTYETQYKYSTTQAEAGKFIVPADVYSTYDIMLFIEDKISGATKVIKGYSARRVFDIWKSKFSIAFGKIAELQNAFEVLFENIKLTGKTKVSIEGGSIDIVPSDTGQLLYKGTNIFTHSDFFGQKLLWEGSNTMGSGQTISLSTHIGSMKNGIVLVFGRDTSYNLTAFFVPKETVYYFPGVTWVFPLCTSKFDYIGSKTLYISGIDIKGHADNTATAKNSISGITYHNEQFYLKKIYEV